MKLSWWWQRLSARFTRRQPAVAGAQLWQASFSTLAALESFWQAESETLSDRRAVEAKLAAALPPDQASATFAAYCWVCRAPRALHYDHLYAPAGQINWRERLVCPGCQLNNRLRLAMHVLEAWEPALLQTSELYLTEQLTPLAALLRQRYPLTTCSEFLGDSLSPGSVDARGIRHEDVTALSFADRSFDALLSFDVLEHVPNYRAGLVEFARVLRPGGRLLLSVPFVLNAPAHTVRATLAENGEIAHHLPAEYHGDPVDPEKGVLCFYHFGWEMLDDLRRAGFARADVQLYWSADYGYLGGEQMLIVAER
jgi:hypothetical protein